MTAGAGSSNAPHGAARITVIAGVNGAGKSSVVGETMGGHDIPEATIRERYRRSREHLVALLPRLTSLVVYDNSVEADLEAGVPPALRPLLRMAAGRIVSVAPATHIPEWAHPVVSAAILSDERQAGRAG